MAITAAAVKELRDKTGVGMMDCKKALAEADGDIEKAIDVLRKKGIAKAAKKAGRSTNEGLVYSYIHPGGRLGVLLEVNCETDFVANTEQFQQLCHDLSMHIAAAAPMVVKREEVPEDVLARELDIFKSQAMNEGKPEHIAEKIVSGRIEKFYKESVLMEQEYIRDTDKTVKDVLNEVIAGLGENMSVARFQRFALGESAQPETDDGEDETAA
jgi:elongation factor Ts